VERGFYGSPHTFPQQKKKKTEEVKDIENLRTPCRGGNGNCGGKKLAARTRRIREVIEKNPLLVRTSRPTHNRPTPKQPTQPPLHHPPNRTDNQKNTTPLPPSSLPRPNKTPHTPPSPTQHIQPPANIPPENARIYGPTACDHSPPKNTSTTKNHATKATLFGSEPRGIDEEWVDGKMMGVGGGGGGVVGRT